MKFVKSSCLFLCFLLLSSECLSAPELLCSKFSYDEQLLEKMVRMEFDVNNMEKNMLATEKSMLETQTNMEDTLKGINDKLKQLEEKEAIFMENIDTAVKERQDDRVVAFHAREATDKSLVINQVILFAKVTMNKGDGYDNSNGYFTAPFNGVYHFTSHLCVKNGKNLDYIFVVKDKTWASGYYQANADGTCTSFSVTVQMQSGERAWVTIDANDVSSTDLLFESSGDWNYFSGFLVHHINIF